MSDENENPQTARREFIASSARFVAIGGMATFAISQTQKGKLLANDPNCIKLHTCLDCVELGSGCKLEKAVAFRAAQANVNPPGTPPTNPG